VTWSEISPRECGSFMFVKIILAGGGFGLDGGK